MLACSIHPNTIGTNLVGMAGVLGIHRVTCDPLHPFNHPKEGPRARAFTPDNMEPEEIEAFPEYYKSVMRLVMLACDIQYKFSPGLFGQRGLGRTLCSAW